MARLKTYVHLHHDHGSTVFGPGEDVPEWAVKLITAPDVWEAAPTPKKRRGRPPKKAGPQDD